MTRRKARSAQIGLANGKESLEEVFGKENIMKKNTKKSVKLVKAAEGVSVAAAPKKMSEHEKRQLQYKIAAEIEAKEKAAKEGKVEEEKKEGKVAEGVKVADSKVEAKIAALLEEMSELYSKFSLGVTALAEAVKVQEALIEKMQEKKEKAAAKAGKEEPAADAGKVLNHLPGEKPAKMSRAEKKAAKIVAKEAAKAEKAKNKTAEGCKPCKFHSVCLEKYGEDKMKVCKSFKAA